jgi:type I restriction enzyme S subunit
MIVWEEHKLGDIVKIGRGASPRPIKNYVTDKPGIPWVKIADATKSINKYIERTNEFIIEEGRRKTVYPGELIVSNSATPGIPKLMKIEACVHDGWLVFDEYKNIETIYLYYFFLDYRRILAHSASGTVFKNLTTEIVRNVSINLPPLKEQKAIAKVLTAFDDKIELLQAQNKTLETMAQTIFKEWFGKYQIGDELPEGWRVGVIGDLIEIKRGGSPRPIKDYISDSGYRWLKISDASATSSPYIFIIKEHIKKEGLKKTTLKHKGDLVLSNSATPGIPKFLAVDTCVHDGWMHFPSSKVSNEYLYLLFLSIRPKLVQQGSGSVFVNLKTDTLRQFETIIASKNDFKAFDNIIKPIFTKIYNNALQIQSLTKTRDTLLPKLMSGQVRVNNIKQTVDA